MAGPKRGGGGPASSDKKEMPGSAEPGADQANLKYANETTNLVLDYLQDQIDRGAIDPELKQRFGWTDKEFADFLKRYRNLQQQRQLSGQAGKKGKKEWESVLRSLGLLSPQRNLRNTQLQKNKAVGLRESGRSRPPQEDQNRFDAFRKDILAR